MGQKIKDSIDNINNYLSILSMTYTINDTTTNAAVSFTETKILENIFISLNYIYMSYTGNSKEAIQQLAGVDVVITNLQSDLTSETNIRIDAVASLRDDLNIEVGNRKTQDSVLNSLIDNTLSTLYAELYSAMDNEANKRITADNLIKADILL